MRKGTYTGRRVDFSNYTVSFFNPYLFTGELRSRLGCGPAALALLTGLPPEVVAAKNGGQHTSDAFVLRFLRARGYSMLPLTQCNVSNSDQSIGANHVVLLSQLFRKNESTWGIIFGDHYYHNFVEYDVSSLSLLNKPILTAYLVMHWRWRLLPVTADDAKPKAKLKHSTLTLTELRRTRPPSKNSTRT
jgi:hypothetical protein